MKVPRSAKKSASTPGRVKRPLLAGPLLVLQENIIPSKSTKLLITNLDHNVADSDICELFSEFGCIREVAVHYNCWGYSLGTAHVVFLNHEHAAEAARRYNGVPFDGRPMTITLEGTPHGAHGVQNPLPAKMRLSFGPNHKANGRNPLSQLNVPARGRPPKGVKRLESAPKGFGGLVKPRGRPAVLGNGKNLGRMPTAAELDMELDEYLSQKRKKHVEAAAGKENDDFGNVNDVLGGGVTPYKSAKKKKTPKGTPKTPAAINGKTPKRTPARRSNNSPTGTSTETPKRTPGPGRPRKTTPKGTPGRPLKNSPLSSTTASKISPGRPRKSSQTGTSPKTPKRTPARPLKNTPSRTPGNQSTTTPYKIKLVRVPTKTPKSTEEAAAKKPSETLAAAEESTDTDTAATKDIVDLEAAESNAVAPPSAAEVSPEKESAPAMPMSTESAEELDEKKSDVEEVQAPRVNRSLKTPAKTNAADTPSRRRTTRAPSKTPSKVEPPKKRKASVDETLEEGEILEIEATESLTDLPDLSISKSPKKLSKRRSGRFTGGAN